MTALAQLLARLRRRPLTRRERIRRLVNARAIRLSSAQASRPRFNRERAKASYRRATRRRPLPDDIAGAVRANPERVALDAAGRWWG